jgi:hypothetical protein
LQSQVFGSLARWLLPLDQRDTQAGLKGMTARVASLLLPHLTCEGFGFDCELLTACRRFHLPVTEVPVEVRLEDKVSTTDWRTMVRMVGELRHIRQGWYKKPPVMALPVHPTRREAA